MNEERNGKCWQCSTCQHFPILSSFTTYVPLVNTSRSFPHSQLMFHLSTLPDPFLIHNLCSTCQHFPFLSSFTTYVPLVNTSRSFPHSQLMFHLSKYWQVEHKSWMSKGTVSVDKWNISREWGKEREHFPFLSSFTIYVPLVNTSRSFPHSRLMFHLSTLPGHFRIHDLCSTCQHLPFLSSFMTQVEHKSWMRKGTGSIDKWNISHEWAKER
jgi:hypothetical protein